MDDKEYAAIQIIRRLNEEYGLREWPKTIGVTAATYGRICQYIFSDTVQKGVHDSPILAQGLIIISIQLGKTDSGIMMKDIEFMISK